MADIQQLVLKVTAEGAILTAEQLRQLSGSAKGAEDSFGHLAGRIAGFTTAADLAVRGGQALLRGIKDLAVESVTLAAGFEKSRVTWGVLVGDMAKGAMVFEQIRDFAAKTPLSFEALNQAATTVKGFGVATENLIPTLSRLGDLAMGDNNKLASLALVYGQVYAQGKAKAQDLYQFINAGVPIFNLLAESMGKSSGQIKQLAADGAVTFEEINRAITRATDSGGEFFDMMDKTAQTAAGKWSTAVDNWQAQLAALGETVLPMLTAALDKANAEMERWNRNRGAAQAAANQAGFVGMVSAGNETGALAALDGLDPETIGAWYRAAELANPLPTKKQQAVLDAVYRAWVKAQAGRASPEVQSGTFGMPSDGWIPDFSSGFNTLASYADYMGSMTLDDLIRQNTPSIVTPSDVELVNFNDGGDGGSSFYSDEAQARRNLQQQMQVYQAAESEKERLAVLAEESEKAKQFEEAMAAINDAFAKAGQAAYIDTFKSLGEMLASGEMSAESFAAAIGEIGLNLLNTLPQLMLSAGLQAIVAGQWGVGIALIGASGLVAIGAGAGNWAKSELSSNALGGVYSSPSLHAYANGVYDKPQYFAFGNGAAFGWEGMRAFASGGVFAEAGPEAIMPLSRGYDGKLGVRADGAKVSVIVNNNASGTTATAAETRGPNGEREIVVAVERIVQGMVPSGKLDGLLTRGGARPIGTRG